MSATAVSRSKRRSSDDPRVKPSDYYYPQEISEEMLETCLKLQMDSVKRSLAYTRKLCEEYRN